MKLGLGLYRHMLARDNFRFAKQAGATHIVAHYRDYFKGAKKNGREDQPTGAQEGWGIAGRADDLWTFEELNRLREAVEDEGLKLEAIENFDPGHWYDILLDGPKNKSTWRMLKSSFETLDGLVYLCSVTILA
jgi:mannonate dehydratase